VPGALTAYARAMPNTTRSFVLAACGLFALVIACGGGGGEANSEEAVRRDVEEAFDAVFGEDLDVQAFAQHLPEECPQDIGELSLGLALAQAFLGDADIKVEVSEVELLEDDRALVTMTSSGELGGLFGGLAGESTDASNEEQDLWVLQDDVWRSTSDCEAFDEEREALGLSTTTGSGDSDFGSGFDDDFGPPVPATVGEPLAVGDLTVTINGARLSSEALNSFDDPPQGVLVVVDFTMANNGQQPTSPWGTLDMQLYDDLDRTWDNQGMPFEDVGPGFSQDFEVAWDVPEGATGFRVIVTADTFIDIPLPDDFSPWEVPLGDVS
jgi:hypothetical protein